MIPGPKAAVVMPIVGVTPDAIAKATDKGTETNETVIAER